MTTSKRTLGKLTPKDLYNAICRHLKTMDLEATTRFPYRDGHEWPSGLRQYHEHYRTIAGGGRACEPSWSQRLAQLLQSRFPGTRAEVPCPRTGGFCDLVVPMPGSGQVRIEIKGAWPIEFAMGSDNRPYPKPNRSFKKHLHASTREDFDKLLSLHTCDAAAVGVLLVGFDLPGCEIDGDIESLSIAVGPNWSRLGPKTWIESSYGTRVSIWFWWRELGATKQ
jgi:hypothetical protein